MTWRLISSISLIFIISTSIFTSVYYQFQSINTTNHYAFSQGSEDISGLDVKIAPPTSGVYHGSNPDFGGTEDEVTAERMIDYEELVGKEITWAYFSNNWIEDIEFPEESVRTIDSLDIVPFIRMMPRTTFDQGEADPVYTLQGIIDGDFDDSLIEWAQDAKNTNIPLMVEFGTEVNGDWFPWSGILNGGGETEEYGDPNTADGPERFRDAYRHIIDLFRSEGVNNITWVFHVFPYHEVGDETPTDEPWNSIENYYPGDEYIDWIGTSVYGSTERGKEWTSFTEIMDTAYTELESVSATKPFAILELGIIEDPEMGNKSEWMREALQLIENGTYPRIKAISYWNEKWDNGDNIIDLTVNSSSEGVDIYKELISSPFFISAVQYEFN
ncbi:MAG: glycoside hydrolase family 26 protein [Candidatus Nitrosocosmicus sp.]|nr:glycoside hydrolase family 26 protein [Candidatus Nitrosocosmicus sp.]MDN5866421.1 glycoside hydrolase family 26 protein [Candidatus Nitrosocosmicus sp.]